MFILVLCATGRSRGSQRGSSAGSLLETLGRNEAWDVQWTGAEEFMQERTGLCCAMMFGGSLTGLSLYDHGFLNLFAR